MKKLSNIILLGAPLMFLVSMAAVVAGNQNLYLNSSVAIIYFLILGLGLKALRYFIDFHNKTKIK